MKAGASFTLRPCRLLSARDGAHYMGLGETEFRERYDHLAKRQGDRRLVWDVRDLDAEADKLPYARPKEEPDTGADSMADWKP
jgi:hypothetical protein